MPDAVTVRPGSRVYWHGALPDPGQQGTVVRTGTIRHEVEWDDSTLPGVSLVPVGQLGKVVNGKFVCVYGKDCGRCPR